MTNETMEDNIIDNLTIIGQIDDCYEVAVHRDDEFGIPHFHVIDVDTHGNVFDCALLISDALYLLHGSNVHRLQQELKRKLDEFLNSKNESDVTNWASIVRSWNANNFIQIDTYYENRVMNYYYVNQASLKEYKAYVGNNRFVLIEYWCACKYCQLYRSDFEMFDAWKYSLEQLIKVIRYLDVENGIGRRRTLAKMLVRDYDNNNPDMVKFIISNCGMQSSEFDDVARVCAQGIGELINVMTTDGETVDQYMMRVFGKPQIR